MRWRDLLFIHWPIEPQRLRPFIPPGLEIDTRDGAAWLGVIPFTMSGVRHRILPPIPGLSAFPELNVRTYVRAPGPDGQPRPGVWFFSLDATNHIAIAIARATFLLPYMDARMRVRITRQGLDREIAYESRRTSPWRTLAWGEALSTEAEFSATYRPVGAAFQPQSGSLEHFLLDRYCLYSCTRNGLLYRAEIHHGPWPLHKAQASIPLNTMTAPLGLSRESLDARARATLHYAPAMEVVAWMPEAVAQPDMTEPELALPTLAAS
jgi:uncharacterized protein YqjF (DUF2071 family)